MATIQHLFNRILLIRRKTIISGYKQDFQTVTAEQEAHVQKVTSKSTVDIYGIDRAEYTAWVDISCDIKKNDRVKDDLGREYVVVAVIEQGQDTAINEHKEVILACYPK